VTSRWTVAKVTDSHGRIGHTDPVLPKQIDQFSAIDERGGLHVVRVLERYRLISGGGSDESMRWAKSDRLLFIVDDEFEIEQDSSDLTLIRLPGIGRLTRM
jgi:hypothetical protein